MDVLVRQRPFKEENRGGFENDVDSDEEKLDKAALYKKLGYNDYDDYTEVDFEPSDAE